MMFVLSIVFVALFYIIAIIIEPEDPAQNQDNTAYNPSQLLSSKEPLHIESAAQIIDFTYQFPAPLLFLQESDTIEFLQADMYDLAYNQGFARVARLSYAINGAAPVYLHCIYPKEAFTLLGGNQFHLMTSQEYLGAFPAVRMENSESARLHAQGNLALYSLTLPTTIKDQLTSLGRSAVFLSQPISEPPQEPTP